MSGKTLLQFSLEILFLGISLSASISSCTNSNLVATPLPTTEEPLSPYITATLTKTPQEEDSTPSLLLSATRVPSPTPTPIIYAITQGDTLTSIAYRHGVKLNELLSTNPGIDPNFLTIGMTLTIPTGESSISSIPNPTPIPLMVHEPVCYHTIDKGMWCLALVENNQTFAVENVSAFVHLVSAVDESQLPRLAIPPLNIIPPQKSIPLLVYFPPPVSKDVTPYIELSTVLPVPENDQRYLELTIQTNNIRISENLQEATITGIITNKDKTNSAEKIWLSVIAYDTEGSPVGIRKWEMLTSLPPGEELVFEISVFSLGPNIANVVAFGEARP